MVHSLGSHSGDGIRACILAPTRELAQQVRGWLFVEMRASVCLFSLEALTGFHRPDPTRGGCPLPRNKSSRAPVDPCQRRKLCQGVFASYWLVPNPRISNVRIDVPTKTDVLTDRPAFEHIADILVSTPLRLVHALQHQFVTLDQVEYIAIDEADRLFENGFEHQVGDCTKNLYQREK